MPRYIGETTWVRMVRKAGSRLWYMRVRPAATVNKKRGGKPHPNLDLALVEMLVIPGRSREGVWPGRAAMARLVLTRLSQRGQIPAVGIGKKVYRVPLATTRTVRWRRR